MRFLKTCHALISVGAVESLVVTDRLLSWASSDFADDVVEQLASVEREMPHQGPIHYLTDVWGIKGITELNTAINTKNIECTASRLSSIILRHLEI